MIELLITLPRRLGSYLLIVHRISDALRMQEQRLVSWTSAACVGLFDSLAISVSLGSYMAPCRIKAPQSDGPVGVSKPSHHFKVRIAPVWTGIDTDRACIRQVSPSSVS